jgi:hypothetical protein
VGRRWPIQKALDLEPDPGPQPVSLQTAISEFEVGYVQAKKLKGGTARKYSTLLKQLRAFADDQGYRFVKELDLAALQKFHAGWQMGARAAGSA